MKKTVLFIILFFNAYFIGLGSTPGYWGMFFSQIRLTDKWSLHAETQARNLELKPNLEQSIIRLGANYHLSVDVLLTAGYATISGYQNAEGFIKSSLSHENRAWQQVLLRQSVSRIQFEHRYRLEERWINSQSNSSYRTRMRYLLRVTIPINHKTMVKNTLFCSFYDEVFLNFKSTPYDRNRFYSALGYQFNPSANMQAGAMWQSTLISTKPYGQFTLIYNFDFRKPKS